MYEKCNLEFAAAVDENLPLLISQSKPQVDKEANSKPKRNINYDDILEEIGEFGPWQIVTLLLLWLPVMSTGIFETTYAFTGNKSHEHSEIKSANLSLFQDLNLRMAFGVLCHLSLLTQHSYHWISTNLNCFHSILMATLTIASPTSTLRTPLLIAPKALLSKPAFVTRFCSMTLKWIQL